MAIFISEKKWGNKGNHKYKAQPQKYKNMHFASKRELKRFQQLEFLEQKGAISDLRRQVRFPFYIDGKLMFTYVADHVYIDKKTGETVIEDSKGVVLPMYAMKKKIIEAHYKITIREV